jgi:hypothetical protein
MLTSGTFVPIVRAGATPDAAPATNQSSAASGRDRSLALRPRLFVTNTDGNAVSAYPLGKFGDIPNLVTDPGLASPNALARDAAGRIYVANSTGDAITIYAPGSHGTPNPIATIAGAKTGLKSLAGIALDSKGRIYAANAEGGTFKQGSLTIYPPLATGDIRPIATIGGANTGLNDPVGVALDPRGNIYVVNQAGLTGLGTVTIYPAGSNGDAAPIKSFAAGGKRVMRPSGIALSANHEIYVTNQSLVGGGSAVQVFSVGPRWQISPTNVIEGSCSGMNSPQGVAVDASGDIYVANNGAGPESLAPAVAMYAAGSQGCANPVALICAGPAGLIQPAGLMLDSRRNIYVTDSNANSVLVFAPLKPQLATPTPSPASNSGFGGGVGFSASGTFSATLHAGIDTPLSLCQPPTDTAGNFTPNKSIVSPATGMDHPSGIAFDQSGKLYVANPGSMYRDYDSITIYAPGTDANAVPVATIGSFGATDQAALGSPVALAVDKNIYVANAASNGGGVDSITVYSPGINGNVAPAMRLTNGTLINNAVIQGSLTGLDQPSALAIGPGS